MKILIAPDKFKGALNARDAAENIAKGLLDVLPDAQIEVVPMADGGEGTRKRFVMRAVVPGSNARRTIRSSRDRRALWMDRPGKTCGNGDERSRWHAATFRK